IPLGDLVKGEPLVATITEKTATRAPSAWTIAGKTLPKGDGRAFVTGHHRYTTDIKRDGMLHGHVVRPPAYGATLVKADTSAAEAMRGVVVVRDGSFLAVAAPTAAMARYAAAAIKAEWSAGPGASARTLFADLKGKDAIALGRVEAASVLDGQYTGAYIAPVPR